MSEDTKIQWATHTFNPWIGCTKVSPGCLNCYAENSTPTRVARNNGKELWGKGQPRQRTSAAYWKQPLRWNRDAHKFGVGYGVTVGMQEMIRQRIFPSLCDWLDDEVPIEWLADFLKLIHDTPNLDWLLLTKRTENWHRQLLSVCGHWANHEAGEGSAFLWVDDWLKGRVPTNVWIGTSVEDQKRADERIPELLKIPAAVRFLSVEPLLGPVDLKVAKAVQYKEPFPSPNLAMKSCGIDWVIVGGESGPGARPCNVEWVRDIVRQCQAASVPVFVKQLGSNPIMEPGPITWPCEHPKGGDPSEWSDDLRVREFPR